MSSLNDPIKMLARRFVSLSPHVRMKVAEKLLRWRDENGVEKHQVSCSGARKKSFLEHFWDEVEAAHDDGLHSINPFAGRRLQPVRYAVESTPKQYLMHI